jgi:hypothetical protein
MLLFNGQKALQPELLIATFPPVVHPEKNPNHRITESRGSLMRRLSACVLAIAVLSPFAARAQTPAEAMPPPPPPPPPPPAAVVAPPPAAVEVVPVAAPAAPPAKTWKDFLLIEGLVDAYYQYNFTGSNSLVPPSGGRNFDVNSNTFTLNYAKLGIGVNPEPVGLRIDLGYGATGALINAANPADASAEAFLVEQAYATIAPGVTPGLTLDFGKFVTTAGAEVIEANKNWLYSRSLLFFNIPLLHTGIRATYAASKVLILQASVVNGWNGTGIATDVSKDKTYGVSINYTAPTGTNVIATGYFGKGEALFPPPGGTSTASPDTRVVGDLVVAHTVGALALNLNVDYVNDKAAGYDNFIGAALMGHYTVSDNLTATLRAEYLKVSSDLKLFEVTAGVGLPVGGHYEFRLELREDHANVATYDPDVMGNAQDKDQFTGTGAFLAWF